MNLQIKETTYMRQSKTEYLKKKKPKKQKKTEYLSSFLISFFIFFALTKVPKLIIHSAGNEKFNSVVELH